MAFITISGLPCSGKTRRAQQLKDHIEHRLKDALYDGPPLKVAVVSDDTLNLPRSVYNDGRAEKPARAALFTAVQRQMAQDTILIVDSLNYIKGFRYQMYCAAREHKLRVCTVFVVATHDQCREWNASREDGHEYTPETLDNLLVRYEEPSSMVRWDSPLFTVPWTDADVPADDIWKAITEGIVKPPNAGTQAVPKAPTDALRTLEHTSTTMVAAIMAEQVASGGLGGPVTLSLSSTLKPKVILPSRNVTLSELQRLKRQFVTVHKKAITLGTTEKGAVDWSEESIADKFALYIEGNLKP
ncbi:chromatin associated protein KTI12 [Lentinus tigrinus ALCF2SS1-7]|uniref:Chromatin associated protein KTI12 n=1 Tax=Lentinus tigrinus ALCF2SS1-6 TaxID=1328759 RepID=A0A5C2S2H1_9APHY|nr:chromatin associated protein KTI12 [Lentinus tigrinus ALCF2SS1-6]RPD78814.1 chromatin associated protein KTI12 [Lentinus tigrinus ALCF2SS1-7]